MAWELLILVAALVLISGRRLFHIPVERPAAALVGGALMVVFGYVAPESVVAAIDWATILLLVGMFLVVAVLEATGLFSLLARRLVSRSVSPVALMAGIMATTALLSALVLNDAVVLFYTPVVVAACRALGRDPVPYLVAEMLAANVGSVATPVGNPQNAWIATHAGLTFTAFTARMLVPAVLALVITFLVLAIVSRKELATPFQARDVPTGPPAPPTRLVALGAIGLVGMAAALAASGPLGMPMHVVALAAGSILLFVAPLVGAGDGRAILRRIDWNVVLLFVGLFLLLAGVRGNATFQTILGMLPDSYDSPAALFTLAGVTAVLSNLVSNVPAVLLIGQGLPLEPAAFYTLAAASTLAGNATMVGAAANLLVAERAHQDGVDVSWRRFMAAGLPAAALSLVAAVAWIAWAPA